MVVLELLLTRPPPLPPPPLNQAPKTNVERFRFVAKCSGFVAKFPIFNETGCFQLKPNRYRDILLFTTPKEILKLHGSCTDINL